MADNDLDDAEAGEAPVRGKKKLLIVIILLILLLGGGGAGLYFSGILGGDKDKETADAPSDGAQGEEHAGELGPDGKPIINRPVYYEMPEFLVNLSTTGKKVSFLKMKVTLELKNALAEPVIEANKPRIQDAFNTYLRELRTSDLSGSAGIYRLREELMTRINKTVEPGLVTDILFGEFIVQ